ncbi:pyridoxamine 5'-phosphate oxidase family protein [Actinomadura scrupuli]|uniref:pyridoxamine 5'-phosphate oxidase family protein n=1 Tax=Actinomadura scrupuli TaxID=559629 RepID=UPI003D9728C9
MKFDAHGLEVLDRRQCLSLLASVPLGRIVFTDRALPAIQPVTFVLDGDDVILHTSLGSTLVAATHETVVAFEADDFDTVRRTGWTVTILGHARVVHDPAETARLARLPLQQWNPAPRDRFIRIPCRHVTGRRINPVPDRCRAPAQE